MEESGAEGRSQGGSAGARESHCAEDQLDERDRVELSAPTIPTGKLAWSRVSDDIGPRHNCDPFWKA